VECGGCTVSNGVSFAAAPQHALDDDDGRADDDEDDDAATQQAERRVVHAHTRTAVDRICRPADDTQTIH